MTFDELLERFITVHLPIVSEGTRKRYLVDIDQRIRGHFRYLPLGKIDSMKLEAFRAQILPCLSVKSVNCCLDLLRTMFLKAVEWGMIEKSPYRLRPLKQPEQKYAWWDKREHILRFLAESRKTRYFAAYKLALECGLRVGEIVGLSKQDVDLKRHQIHVHRQWLDHEKCYGPTKGRRERFINFDPRSGLKEALAEAILASPDPEVIFTTSSGQRLRSRKLAGPYFARLIARSKVPPIRFHDLRHTFASWYMIESDDIWSLMGILGHADVQTTQRYAHLSRKFQRIPTFSWNSAENSARSIHAPNREGKKNPQGFPGVIGAGDGIVGEPMTLVREYEAQWVKATVDRDELARLRLVEKWPITRLQAHFRLSKTTIKKELRRVRYAQGIRGYFRVRNGRVCEVKT